MVYRQADIHESWSSHQMKIRVEVPLWIDEWLFPFHQTAWFQRPILKKTKSQENQNKIPDQEEISKDKIIEIYQKELMRKDKIIDELRKQNEILFKAMVKKAKEKK